MDTRVLLADDHAIVRDGVKHILLNYGMSVVGEADNGKDAIALAKKTKPQIALLDYAMPLLNGIDASREIRAVSPETKTCLLTMHRDEDVIFEAMRAGFHAYVLKTQASSELLQAIDTMRKGEMYLSPGVSSCVVNAALHGGVKEENLLTSREREILQLVAEGNNNKEIGRHLNLSWKTVESHRRNLMAKLDVHETAGLVRYAVKSGLIQI